LLNPLLYLLDFTRLFVKSMALFVRFMALALLNL